MISIARTGPVYQRNKNILKANATKQNWLPQEAELSHTSFLPVQVKGELLQPNFSSEHVSSDTHCVGLHMCMFI